MMILLKSLAIPTLALLTLLGVGAACLVVWFLLPEVRPAMRDAARSLLVRIRNLPAR